MADPTDRQRAEAKAKQVLKETDFNIYWSAIGGIATAILEAEQRVRGEDWEAGREAAAKWHDLRATNPRGGARGAVYRNWHELSAAAIRALPTPKEK